MRNVDGASARCDGVGEYPYDGVRIRRRRADRQFAQDNSLPLLAQLPRSAVADVFLIGHQHFVARLQFQSVGHEIRSHGRVLHQRHFRWAGVEKRRHFCAQLFLFAIAREVLRMLGTVVVMRDGLLDLAHVRGYGVHHRARHGAEGAGVEIGLAARNVELFAEPAPEMRIVRRRPANRVGGRRFDILRKRPQSDRGHRTDEVSAEHHVVPLS